MGPPLQSFVPRSHQKSSSLGQKYRDAIEKHEKAKVIFPHCYFGYSCGKDSFIFLNISSKHDMRQRRYEGATACKMTVKLASVNIV